MNKKLQKIIMLSLALLVVPISLMLSGCGATAVNAARGVTFVSSVQKGNQAVFELDLNSPIRLPYKINPSSAYGYSPRFTAVSGISGDNMETYSLDIVTGEFCIKRADFKDVEVEIAVGDYTDTCLIKLKKYPTKIGVYDENSANKLGTSPSKKLAAGSSYQINVAGLFDQETKLMSDSEFNFLVEADENSKTLINIPNKNRLNFVAYDNYGTAKVKVALCDYFGNVIKDEQGFAVYAFEINIEVYRECKSMDIQIDGVGTLISSESEAAEYQLKTGLVKFDNLTAIYEIKFDVEFYDKLNRLIVDENLNVNCFVDKATYISVDNQAKIIYLKTPPSGESFVINVEMWSNAPLETGEFCMTSFKLRIMF